MAITVTMIKELREATGAGVLAAKKALEASNGDFDEAVRALREKGLAKAAKRADRVASEGRIEGRSREGLSGLLVEINCETDFVATNEDFVALANDLADHFFAVAAEDHELLEVMAASLYSDSDRTATQRLQDLIFSTGENMGVRRFARFDLGDRPGVVEVYIHPGNRVAVMVELGCETTETAAKDAFMDLSHDLALHIAANAPESITRDEISFEKLAAEKEIYRNRALEEGKPEKIVDRIVEGRLAKFYQEVVLLEQPFVKDDEVTVGELITRVSKEVGEPVEVRRFVRFELGA